MNIYEQIIVMQHYADGGKIECKMKGKDKWLKIYTPLWDFITFDYRIAKAMYQLNKDVDILLTDTNKLQLLLASVTLDLNDNWVADWEDNSQSKCCLFFDYTSNKYIIDSWYNFKTLGATYISEQVAKKVCEILNNGEYVL